MDSVRVSIPKRMDTPSMTTSDNEPTGQLIENTAKTPPARSRSRRKVRQWPYETKRRIVEATLVPGASVAVIARQNDVNANLVFWWRKLHREGRLRPHVDEPRFMQVGVVGGDDDLAMPAASPAVLVEMEWPGGMRLRVDSRIEEAALTRVLRAVKSSA
jgi:transposase